MIILENYGENEEEQFPVAIYRVFIDPYQRNYA